MGAYELAAQVVAHEGDVRAVAALGQGRIVSGSRDRFAKLLREQGPNVWNEERTLFEHEHWVSAVLALPGDRGFATGSQDKKIRWYASDGSLITSLSGHEGPVSSLAWDAKLDQLVSGSWDGTAKTWTLDGDTRSGACTSTLPGHENGVCVLALPSGAIVTGSAGVQAGNRIEGFQIRVWRDGKQVQSLTSHQRAVRCLSLAGSDGNVFASVSNDGTTRLWDSTSFEQLGVMTNPTGPEGTPAFNFSVTALPGGQVAVGCDDCCARVWRVDSGEMVAEVPHPCTVWCVATLANGDLVTGGSDGQVRIFTADAARMAPQVVRENYLEQTEQVRLAIANKASNSGQQVDVNKLAKIYEAPPGNADGDVRMFNKEGQAWAYQWSSLSGTWVEVGEVMGDGGKEELDGKLYDRVIPVELEDPSTGGLRKLKLGFNNGDNPYLVAQDFVSKHELSENHVQEIADFVQNVRKQSGGAPTIDMSGGGGGGGGAASGAGPMDVDLGVASRAAAPAPRGPFPLPSASGLVFDAVDLGKVMSKLEETNGELDGQEGHLSEAEVGALREMASTLKETSRYHASSISRGAVRALEKALRWPADKVFPTLDLARVALLHPSGAEQLAHGGDLFVQALAQGASEGATLALALLGARVAANHFRHREAAGPAVDCLVGPGAASRVVPQLDELAGFPNKNVRLSVSTALLNCCNALAHGKKGEAAAEDVAAALAPVALKVARISLDQGAAEAEAVRRALLAVGCALAVGADCADTAQELLAAVDAAGPAAANTAVAEVASALRQRAGRAGSHK